MIRDGDDWHVEYCWINPVKHGLVGAVRDWPLTSFHRDVRRGSLVPDWAGNAAEGDSGSGRVGEVVGESPAPYLLWARALPPCRRLDGPTHEQPYAV